jgi:hypothetical protein
MTFQFLPGLREPLPDEVVVVRHAEDEYVLDVLGLCSNYRCIYGQGCRGTTPVEGEQPGLHRPANPGVAGCCRTSPEYTLATAEVEAGDADAADSPLRVQPFVDALRPDEAQHYDQIAAGPWYTETQNEEGVWRSRHVTVGGNCVFLNTEGPEGKLGCALFHLALRLGLDPKQTRPAICHMEPAAAFVLADGLPGGGRRVLVTLRPPWYGWFKADDYFCTSDPAAYSATEPVFRRMRSEYSALLGEDVYTALLPAFEEIWAERGERIRRNWGRPVPLPVPTWVR